MAKTLKSTPTVIVKDIKDHLSPSYHSEVSKIVIKIQSNLHADQSAQRRGECQNKFFPLRIRKINQI